MDFTQINQISYILNLPYQEKIAQNILNYATVLSLKKIKNQQEQSQEYWQLIKILDQIHHQQKINSPKKQTNNLLNNSPINIESDFLFRSNTQDININLFNLKDNQQTQQIQKQQYNLHQRKRFDKNKSLMFKKSSQLGSSRSIIPSSQLSNSKITHYNEIKVYYFNKPIYKFIPYTKTTKIKQFIQKSLQFYLADFNDAIKANQSIQKFQIRLPMSDQNYNYMADMEIQAIDKDRILSENMFESLVLVEKSRKDISNSDNYLYQSKTTKQYSLEDSHSQFSHQNFSNSNIIGHQQNLENQTITITLSDQTYYELFRLQIDVNDTLEKVFQIINDNKLINQTNFVLRQNPHSQFDLPPDQQIKLLETNRLYVMPKKYLDQGDQDYQLRPIRLKTLINRQVNYLPPIGINQASKYQQFLVTKISSMGIAIQRVIGIDQTKLYNYGKQVRQNNRQLSLFDKFLGMNQKSGTKKPYRSIKDIKQIRRFHGGFQLVYEQKITTYFVKDQVMMDKIYRKLNFLIKRNQNKNNKQKQKNI